MSWTRTILYGTGLSGVFYFYFGTLIVGELTVWVLQALAPAPDAASVSFHEHPAP